MLEAKFEPLPFDYTPTSQRFGRRPLFIREVDSTNQLLRELAREGATEGSVLLTDFQSSGRGRQGRGWVAPPGSSLLFSLLLRPPGLGDRQGLLSMVIAVAIARTLEKQLSLQPAIKWPNDILLANRKCCGILIESEQRGSRQEVIIVGIGLNVNQEAETFAELPGASSVRLAYGEEIDRGILLAALLTEVEQCYYDFLSGWQPHDAWRHRSPMLGREITVHPPEGEPWPATALDLGPDGTLLVKRPDGQIDALRAVDVSVRHDF